MTAQDHGTHEPGSTATHISAACYAPCPCTAVVLDEGAECCLHSLQRWPAPLGDDLPESPGIFGADGTAAKVAQPQLHVGSGLLRERSTKEQMSL
jgi:hypothetical protein